MQKLPVPLTGLFLSECPGSAKPSSPVQIRVSPPKRISDKGTKVVPLSEICIQEKNSEETAIVMAYRTAHGCSLPVKSVRGREGVS